EGFRGAVDPAVRAQLAGTHGRVHVNAAPFEAVELPVAGSADAIADECGGLATSIVAQLLTGEGGYLDVDVDAVEERTRDAREVALHLRGRAHAAATATAMKAAGARIHRSDQHEARWIGER